MSAEKAKHAATPHMKVKQCEVIVHFMVSHNLIAAGKTLGLDPKKTAEVN